MRRGVGSGSWSGRLCRMASDSKVCCIRFNTFDRTILEGFEEAVR